MQLLQVWRTRVTQVLLSFSARELELEDQQSHLQQELRDRMTVDGNLIEENFKDT